MAKIFIDNLEKIDIEGFQQDLINWFQAEQRTLPWRENKDPYRVWVSEIMLQQTRVDTVIPYFNNFVEQFPTINDLAEADEDKVLKAWEGLGYYSRVRNLQSAVKEVKEVYGGIVPKDPKEIAKLKGVGPYTAGAILSIAYGVPEPAVDGNVMRVFSRILSIWEDIAKPASRKVFEEAVRAIIAKDNPSDFNQALMELGALICTPTSPSCLLCPVREHCIAFHEGKERELPIKTKNKKTKKVQLAAAILSTDDGRYLIRKRPAKGLLANLWEFPQCEDDHTFTSTKRHLQEYLLKEHAAMAEVENAAFGKIEHVFSHLVWNIDVYAGRIEGEIDQTDTVKLVTEEEMKEFAFPVSHQKMWKQYKEK
ncbi:A/G-specific adenine glycosylase [Falsibacillus pallidus]|uniref:Adenine DNA glycosylase n=1 Tax=Falsibacillus pallidus TaxID=493781 RepID=A0A370FZS9_9BACI|nr:A/G-specific adenine glycosylase [Falsibacillus pallidus]RDI37167.1 A/G-specific DNA-adenine glycosylase [Falsibacillus pallidus]